MGEVIKTLFKKSKKGKILEWSIEIDQKDGVPLIVRKSGTQCGKFTTKERMVHKGTNIGKANEKSPYEHALFLIEGMITEKIEDNFVEDIARIDDPPIYWYPMLAQPFDRNKPRYTKGMGQPKLNGLRGWSPRHMDQSQLTIRGITPESFISREMHPWTLLDHIKNELHIFGKYSPDGEIYKHGVPLQTINSWATNPEFEKERLTLEYWVYDLAIPGVNALDRQRILKSIVPFGHPVIKIVPAIRFDRLQDFYRMHDEWYQLGFEGAMFRTEDAEYGFNDRVFDLMKDKYFDDAEFIVVDHEIEEYHDIKTDQIWKLVVWVCEVPENGERFTVRPVGLMENRRIEIVEPEKQVGKKYNVRFQEKSIDGIPIFPTGRGFRE